MRVIIACEYSGIVCDAFRAYTGIAEAMATQWGRGLQMIMEGMP